MVEGGVITGAKLAEVRKRAGLTIEDLAKAAGLWPFDVQMIEGGYWPVTPTNYAKLAPTLGLPPLAEEKPSPVVYTAEALATARVSWELAYARLQYMQRHGRESREAWNEFDRCGRRVRELEEARVAGSAG